MIVRAQNFAQLSYLSPVVHLILKIQKASIILSRSAYQTLAQHSG